VDIIWGKGTVVTGAARKGVPIVKKKSPGKKGSQGERYLGRGKKGENGENLSVPGKVEKGLLKKKKG